jgi:hypothetical protein
MKFKAFSKPVPVEKEICLKFEESFAGMKVIAVNSDGSHVKDGHIITFLNNGKLRLETGVSDDLGLSLSTSGIIVTAFDNE